MLKVLHIVSALNSGGIENILLNYYKVLDKEKIRFDFLVHKGNGSLLEKEFEILGSRIYHISSQRKNIFRNRKELKAFFLKNSNYDIIHFHHGILSLGVGIAKKYSPDSKVVIHSHSIFEHNIVVKCFKPLIQKYLIKKADYYGACSVEAATYLYGKKLVRQNKVTIINNAIDTSLFGYNNLYGEELCGEFGINRSVFICGTVGRFNYAKNPFFILEIVDKLRKVMSNFKFIWVGNGELKEDVKKKIEELGLDQYIILAGLRKDVYKFYSFFDVFILPSLYEGMPVVSVECQWNGCPLLLSNHIPSSAKIAENCYRLPLESDNWVKHIIAVKNQDIKRENNQEKVATAGYDIQKEAKKLANFYEGLS